MHIICLWKGKNRWGTDTPCSWMLIYILIVHTMQYKLQSWLLLTNFVCIPMHVHTRTHAHTHTCVVIGRIYTTHCIAVIYPAPASSIRPTLCARRHPPRVTWPGQRSKENGIPVSALTTSCNQRTQDFSSDRKQEVMLFCSANGFHVTWYLMP